MLSAVADTQHGTVARGEVLRDEALHGVNAVRRVIEADIGVTGVFVPEDLAFMQTTPAALQTWHLAPAVLGTLAYALALTLSYRYLSDQPASEPPRPK